MTDSKPTSRDVARVAGVSRTTVSYVLNGNIDSISAETQARVWEAVRQIGYVPNLSAQSLRRGESDEVCLILSWPSNWLFNYDFLFSIEQIVHQHGYHLTIYTSGSADPAAQAETLNRVLARRPLAVLGSALEITPERYRQALSLGVKACLAISFYPSDGVPTLILPVRQVGERIGEHLRSLGHRAIGMVIPEDPFQRLAVEERLVGLRAAFTGLDWRLQEISLDGRLESARAAVARWRGDPQRPSAIYGFNDEYSIQLLKALVEQGVRVPEEITLVGTDNLSICELVHPALTSVKFDLQSWVERGLQALLDQIEARTLPNLEPIWMHPELVVRSTSGPARQAG